MKKYIAAGATFAMLASAGIAGAQSSPALGANLYVSPRVERGAQDTLLALVTLSARDSNSTVQLPSLRLETSFTNGATVGDITDCRVRNINNLTAALNNGGNAVGITSGSTVIPLDTPYVVATGTTATLAITCDVASTAALGGTITMGLAPSSQTANVQGSSTTVTVTTGKTTTGANGPTSGVAQVVLDATPTPPTVPGVPNTGNSPAGNMLLLVLAGLTAVGGFVLARRIALA